MEKPRLLILGASTRAAAMSAASAGFHPICADLFADTDLREIAPVQKIADYPQGLITAAENVDPGDWMYVGAMENHPTIVAHVSARHRLLGNAADIIRDVRDPVRVTEFLSAKGFSVLDVRSTDNPPTDGEWLRKPLKSAAGHGIRAWKPGFLQKPGFWPQPPVERLPPSRASHYYQQRGDGDPISATFVAFPKHCELVGVTRQLIGVPEWNTATFGYCGSIGPLDLPSSVIAIIQRMGNELAGEFELRGLFGIDLLWDGECVQLTEINPRYTASVEILESATGRKLIGEHTAACGCVETSHLSADRNRQTEEPVVGKAIVFAGREVTVGSFPEKTRRNGVLQFADVPAEGTTIRSGDPICTVFAEGASVDDCRAKLNDRAAEVLRRFRA